MTATAALLACVPRVSTTPGAVDDDSTEAATTGSGTQESAATYWESGASATSTAETGDDTTAGFVDTTGNPCSVQGDRDSCGSQCDIWWAGDCGQGQKCTAVSCEVCGTSWDSNVCRDIMGGQAVGAPCEFLGNGVDGNDNCVEGSMCWDQDADTGLGTCVAFCTGTPSEPECGEGELCFSANDGVLNLCVPSCDPLAQDCGEGEVCISDGMQTGFACVLDGSGQGGAYGDTCSNINGCNPGLMCAGSGAVPEPGCDAAFGCCSPFCEVNAPNMCPGAFQVCESLYESGMEPAGYEHIGVCAVPE